MSLPTDSLVKLFVAQGAFESLVFVMDPAMLDQVLLAGERLRADIANEGLLFSVYYYVFRQAAFIIELDFTERAREGVVRMRKDEVSAVRDPLIERLATIRTGVGFGSLSVNGYHMIHFQFPRDESLSTMTTGLRPALLR